MGGGEKKKGEGGREMRGRGGREGGRCTLV